MRLSALRRTPDSTKQYSGIYWIYNQIIVGNSSFENKTFT